MSNLMEFSPPPRQPCSTKAKSRVLKPSSTTNKQQVKVLDTMSSDCTPSEQVHSTTPIPIPSPDQSQINEQLHSLSELYGIFNLKLTNADSTVLSLLNKLTEERKTTRSNVDSLSVENRELKNNSQVLTGENKNLNNLIYQKDQEQISSHLKIEQITNNYRVDRKKLLLEKDEWEKRFVRLNSKDLQYQATIKKNEAEFFRLKDLLMKSNSSASKSASCGGNVKEIDIKPKPLQKTNSNCNSNSNGCTDDLYYSKLLSTLEMHNADLLFQNSELRSTLQVLQEKVQDVLGKQELLSSYIVKLRKTKVDDTKREVELSQINLSTEMFNMPMEWLEENLIPSLYNQLLVLSESISEISSTFEEGEETKGVDEPEKSEVEALKKKIIKLKGILDSQDAIIQETLQSMYTSSNTESDLNDSQIEEIRKGKEEMSREREKLDNEWIDVETMRVTNFMSPELKSISSKPASASTSESRSKEKVSITTIEFDPSPATKKILNDIGVFTTGVVGVNSEDLFK